MLVNKLTRRSVVSLLLPYILPLSLRRLWEINPLEASAMNAHDEHVMQSMQLAVSRVNDSSSTSTVAFRVAVGQRAWVKSCDRKSAIDTLRPILSFYDESADSGEMSAIDVCGRCRCWLLS